mmetsp:Transcript_30500/g.76343  ORF Transcript_30500/g.76343 Transcript_30500/m.76343 type:complete len:126 (-) Transcript_30500:103-480(-)
MGVEATVASKARRPTSTLLFTSTSSTSGFCGEDAATTTGAAAVRDRPRREQEEAADARRPAADNEVDVDEEVTEDLESRRRIADVGVARCARVGACFNDAREATADGAMRMAETVVAMAFMLLCM